MYQTSALLSKRWGGSEKTWCRKGKGDADKKKQAPMNGTCYMGWSKD